MLLCLITSCQDKDNAKTFVVPEGIIGRVEMKEILKDIHRVEVLSKDKHLKLDSTYEQSSVGWYYEDVYRRHSVSEEQFKQSFDYYSQHFKPFMAMYDEMISEMQAVEKELKKKDREAREKLEIPAKVKADK